MSLVDDFRYFHWSYEWTFQGSSLSELRSFEIIAVGLGQRVDLYLFFG